MKHYFPENEILAALPLGIIAADASGRVRFANPEAGRMLGGEASRLSGRPLAELSPEAAGALRRALGEGEPVRVVLSERRLVCEAVPLPRGRGAAVCLRPVGRCAADSGCERASEQVVRQLEAIFDASSDGIWVTDGEGTIISINRASKILNDVDPSRFVGKNIESILAEGLVDRSVTLEVLRTRQKASIIQNIKATSRQLLVTGTPVFDERGEIFLVVVNERDITELNNLRKGLERARKAQEKAQSELMGLTMLEIEDHGIVAESKSMRQVLTMALKLAHLDASEILLLGESGTGKGLMAKFIHKMSPRKARPFMQINCAALPANLFEAELFGYERGAFTGAAESGKAGLLELAQDGTFFLDEIGEIPLEVQAKLLKCLDDREFIPLGGGEAKKVSCRFIAATNRDLEERVRRKRFREDLYYRLNTFTVRIPPLRERAEDIFDLLGHYLRRFNTEFGVDKRVTHRAVKLLQNYAFPGNVRELVSIVKKAVAICEERELDDFIRGLIGVSERPEPGRRRGSLPEQLDQLERELMEKALSACATTREMARFLGISQPSVVRKLKRHGLERLDSDMNH